MDKIEELEEKALELEDRALKLAIEIAKLKKGQNGGEWEPQEGEIYYFMSYSGNVNSNRWVGDCVDIGYSKYTLLFKTEEECQKYCDYRKALIERSYKFSEAEWENDSIPKYFLYYSHTSYDWFIETQTFRYNLGLVYFKTQEDAEFMIDNYSEEMLKWGLN